MKKVKKVKDLNRVNSTNNCKLSSTPRIITLALSSIMIFSVITKVFNINIFGFTYQGISYLYLLVATFLPLIFIWIPANQPSNFRIIPTYDWIIACISFALPFYLFLHAIDVQNLGWGSGTAPFYVQVMSFVFILIILEATRRVSGLSLFLICLFFALFPLFAGYMPGPLAGITFPFWRTVCLHVMGGDSLFGMVMQVVGNLVIGYLVFGVFFQVTGGGKFFLDLSFCFFGRVRGGAAKVAIVASSFFGSISGSPTSNVLSTGVITIPAMKKTGFPAYYAASVEAVASTGGSIMPPVMGSAGFFCAQFLGIPYYQVALAALIPSILYYIGVFIQVDFFAAKNLKKGLAKEDIPSLGKVLKEGWYYFFAIVIMVFFIFMRQESKAPFYATAVLLVTSMIKKQTRLSLSKLQKSISDVGMSVARVCGILLGVGFIVGSLSVTGVAHSFSYEVVRIAGNNLAFLLLFGAMASFVLGTGMVASAAYLFLALTLAPAFIKIGIYPLAAHLFVLYWGIISNITPPVALASMTAAGLAGAPSTKVGFKSMQLAMAIYIVPFAFVLNPALIGHGSIVEITVSVLFAVFGLIFMSSALQGSFYQIENVNLFWRCVFLVTGILFFFYKYKLLIIIGIVLGSVSIAFNLRNIRKR